MLKRMHQSLEDQRDGGLGTQDAAAVSCKLKDTYGDEKLTSHFLQMAERPRVKESRPVKVGTPLCCGQSL